MVEASVNGTLRTILVLMILWLVLRMFLRSQQARGVGRSQDPPRRPGDVRIEDPRQQQASPIRPNDTIVDADYEEIK
ncbi:MAG: hypothetical protein ABI432_04590 [Flavobacteriales bacterium]